MAKDQLERSVTAPRTYLLEKRDPIQKFGFIAGYLTERRNGPGAAIRKVDPTGPSANLLRVGDIIVEINGVNVEEKSLDTVVKMVQRSDPQMTITVRQPKPKFSSTLPRHYKVNQNQAKSIDLKEKLRDMIKIFLENDQTKVFKYEHQTTIKDLISSLNTKLAIKSGHHFGLALEHTKSTKRNQLHLLDNNDSISKIANISESKFVRILYRMIYPPQNVTFLSNNDGMAFDYLYRQSCGDLKHDRFTPELRYENVLKLAALHIVQHVAHSVKNGPQFHPNNAEKFYKIVKKEPGLAQFLPEKILKNTNKKTLKRDLLDFIEKNFHDYDLKPNTIKLIFLNVLSKLPSYGAKLFSTSPLNEAWPTKILVNERYGISVLEPTSNKLGNTPDFMHANPITQVSIDLIKLLKRFDKEKDMCIIEIYLRNNEEFSDKEPVKLSLVKNDSKEFITTLKGYYKAIAANTKLQNFDGSIISDKSLDSIELEVMTCDWSGEHGSLSSFNTALTMQAPSISDNQQNHASASTVSMSSSERSIERSLPSDEPVYANRSYGVPMDRGYGLSLNRGYRKSINRQYEQSMNTEHLINRDCGVPITNGNDIRMSYKNVIGFNGTKRTSTPSSFIGDVSDFTNVHKIQFDLDDNRQITIAVDVNNHKPEFFDSHASNNTLDSNTKSTVDWVDAASNGYRSNVDAKYPSIPDYIESQPDLYRGKSRIRNIYDNSHENSQQFPMPNSINGQPDIFQRNPSVRRAQEEIQFNRRQPLTPDSADCHPNMHQGISTPKNIHDDFIFPSPPLLQDGNVSDTPVSELAVKFSTVALTDKDIESWIFPTPPRLESTQRSFTPVVPTIRRSKVQNRRKDADQMPYLTYV